MGEHLFVSDLHLAPQYPATAELFLAFLAERAPQATALYILGDLFDAWIGDDDDSPFNRRIETALRTLTDGGTACLIQRGNRDFLLGRHFAHRTGCRLLRDPALLDLDNERVLLMHGDLLCTDDRAYQRFRRRVRNPLVQWVFLRRPLAARRALAADYRARSGAENAAKSAAIMDVNQAAVSTRLHRHRAARLVHGHTHRPDDHCHNVGGQMRPRQVLADWHAERGEVLVHDAAGWRREPVLP